MSVAFEYLRGVLGVFAVVGLWAWVDGLRSREGETTRAGCHRGRSGCAGHLSGAGRSSCIGDCSRDEPEEWRKHAEVRKRCAREGS